MHEHDRLAIVAAAGPRTGGRPPLRRCIRRRACRSPSGSSSAAACHGEDGNSRMENIPSLAGQPEFFMLNQLFLMREGVRPDRGDDAVRQGPQGRRSSTRLAAHFAELAAKAERRAARSGAGRAGAELADRGAAAHAIAASLAGQEQMPRLAKQRVDYLIHSLKEFRDNTRPGADTLMSVPLPACPTPIWPRSRITPRRADAAVIPP